mgnify:CR=1 FL=1
MAKKKQEAIKVKSPKIGDEYFFVFAGTIMFGKIVNVSEKLTKIYGQKWYTMTSKEDGHSVRYPVSSYNIANTERELRNY